MDKFTKNLDRIVALLLVINVVWAIFFLSSSPIAIILAPIAIASAVFSLYVAYLAWNNFNKLPKGIVLFGVKAIVFVGALFAVLSACSLFNPLLDITQKAQYMLSMATSLYIFGRLFDFLD